MTKKRLIFDKFQYLTKFKNWPLKINSKYSDKFKLMSKRMTEMEQILTAKNTEIQHLKEDQLGHVLVEENFLENIEATFSKFQG